MVENTCIKKDCFLWKKYKTHCPNYIRTGWRDSQSGTVKDVDDCTPRRTIFLLQDISSKLIALQKENNLARNSDNQLTTALVGAIQYASKNPGKVNVTLPLEVKDVGPTKEVSKTPGIREGLDRGDQDTHQSPRDSV